MLFKSQAPKKGKSSYKHEIEMKWYKCSVTNFKNLKFL